jgi:murein DD-endopeptidase MepM/ murein hydrolase activator NlpD
MNLTEKFVLSVLFATLGIGCAHHEAGMGKPVASEKNGVLAQGRRWASAFYARQTQDLWNQFGDPMRNLLHTQKELDDFRQQIDGELGAESKVLDEKVTEKGGVPIYVRTAQFTKIPTPFRVLIGFDPNGLIVAFGIVPSGPATAAPTSKLDYKTHTPLRLPFKETWTVVWGGRTIEQNQHAVSRSQRFAYDFLIERSGTTHRGDGKKNEDYFCYGQAILAPGPGRVVAAVDGIGENVPGEMNAQRPPGNHVVIDHGDGEFSLLAHLQPSSLRVRIGDRVEAGQVIGRCGNSGHSSEPHLHYHLQNAAPFGSGEGLPAQFLNYVANGNRVARGEPVRGETVQDVGDEARSSRR